MKTVTTILAVVLVSILTACAQNFSGTYYGTYDGAQVACQMIQKGNQVTGLIEDDKGASIEFSGTVSGAVSKGSMVANGLYALSYTASLSGNNCTFSIRAANGQGIAMNFTVSKQGTVKSTAATAKPAGNLDRNVVGRWMKETNISSGGGFGDYASFTSVTYYQYNADGTYCITDGGAAGGGADWSYSGGAQSGATCGKWYVKDGYLYTIRNGETYYVKYTLYNGQLVFGTKGNYQFLSNAN